MKNQSTTQTPPRRGGVEWRNLNWSVIVAIAAVHLVAFGAVFPSLFSWSGVVLMLVMMWLSGGMGVVLCYHRLLTHRSFRTPKWFEYLLTACGCLAWQGGPAEWVGVHRLHHKFSDTEHDPHSPNHGFTWAHILWTLHRKIEGIEAKDAAKDLLRDPVTRWMDRWFWVPQLVVTVGLLAAGWAIGGVWLGLSWVVWGVGLRTVIVFHGTWFVNSAAHTWGYQNYDTGEHSTNLWWVAVLTFGEGWHNNHHAHARSAAHGLRWYEFDVTWWTIRLLEKVGLARDIHLPKPEQMPGAQPAERENPEPEKPSEPVIPAWPSEA